ncbi:sigma 54-interacting transcriptional regulator, partial [Escherichia coli]|nr:sigma 54-interacting transcriptional regulator [Escherichia coli]
GYERGAFSGANSKGKKGKIELAQGGTLFLDEIGEMPLDMQVKLLRVLQERKYYRVGGEKEIHIDFRIIAATNRDLQEEMKKGTFREDLYYRLNVVSLHIPPLRERREDIIELTYSFLNDFSINYNRPI